MNSPRSPRSPRVALSKKNFISKSNRKLHEDYDISEDILGEGTYGVIKKVFHKASKVDRAMKILSKKTIEKDEMEQIHNEIELLK